MSDFKSLGIRPELVQTLQSNGLTEPTPIQEKTIPIALSGKDVIAQAQTGTGKTLAFVLPILEIIDPEKSHVQALIVTPTRELALQITTEVKKLAASVPGTQVLAVYGGQDVERQMKKLQGTRQIVIGTPGRLLDHMRRGTIQLNRVSMLVLDEADQMLHMGFLTEVEEVIRSTPSNRQTMLLSATMPKQIRSLAARFMRQPEDVLVRGKQVTLEDIRQIAVSTSDRGKQSALCAYIDREKPYLAMIFCRTKRRASTLNEALIELGYDSDELHGDLSQAKREQVMKRFREAKLQLLVATDVAARGLDVEGVTHVFNYDIPHDVESYIHRIGRTGRAGGEGMAVTFVSPQDRMFLETIERGINQKIERQAAVGGPGASSARDEEVYDDGESGGARRGGQDGKSPRARAGQAAAGRRPGQRTAGRDGQRAGQRSGRSGPRDGQRTGQSDSQRGGKRAGQRDGQRDGQRGDQRGSQRAGQPARGVARGLGEDAGRSFARTSSFASEREDKPARAAAAPRKQRPGSGAAAERRPGRPQWPQSGKAGGGRPASKSAAAKTAGFAPTGGKKPRASSGGRNKPASPSGAPRRRQR